MAAVIAQSNLDAKLLSLINDSPIASVLSDPRQPDNPIVACNRAFCDLTGYPPEEVVGRNCRFLSGPGTEPWLSERIRQGVREHRPVLVEILNYKRDGTPFRNAVLVAPIYDECDELLYFLGSQVEIDSDMPLPSSQRRLRAAELVKSLSPRQWQVLKLAASGLLNKQIAAELGLSEKTIKMHRAILMDRLGTPTTADMIRVAVEAGL
ncbi:MULTISPECIES: LuxR C-terminal-related transcriptional regulator [Sphingomonas]|uniref:LuxR C-terminal-related transcriptional regulator n=1 Tax=Sphingomonas TaxID=13687 RepID=UPI0008334A11|nr:LuxR C-terminal-related transcriptional regulator [Sphingomonas sp. CCH10-B3]MBA3880086.1 transcriptional regulator UhpA [Sphingobium sp.]